MVNNHYRWDFIGLSTDTKPTPETSEKVVNGSTFYTSDDSKLYVWCDGSWYEKVVSGGGGGTSNFNQLTNRPKYNGTTMTGDTNIPEVVNTAFTGTDGTAAGTAGLVPAPATTDAGKFLKADGTWDNAGGGVTELTSADYNWPENNPDGIAIWKLKAGLYYQTSNTKIYITTSVASSLSGMYIYVATDDIYANVFYGNINSGWIKSSYNISSGDRLTQTTFLNTAEHLVQTTGTSTTNVMSQKAVTDAIAAIPTGGDAFTELTSTDYNYPADNPDGVAVWLLPLGLYKFADGVKIYFTSTTPYTASTSNPQYLGVMMDDIGSITGQKLIVRFALHISSAHSRDTMQIYVVNSNGTSSDYQSKSYVLRSNDIYNGLNQTSTGWVLDAKQGKVLDDKITALEARVAALEGN